MSDSGRGRTPLPEFVTLIHFWNLVTRALTPAPTDAPTNTLNIVPITEVYWIGINIIVITTLNSWGNIKNIIAPAKAPIKFCVISFVSIILITYIIYYSITWTRCRFCSWWWPVYTVSIHVLLLSFFFTILCSPWL